MLFAAFALIVAACGDDDDVTPTQAPPAATDAPGPAATDAPGPAATDAPGPAATDAPPATDAPMVSVPSDPDNGVTDDEILLGWMGDLTGPTAGTQLFFEAGIRARLQFVNEAGGVADRQFRLISKDDAFSQEEGALNYVELVEDERVLAVVGQGNSSIITNLSPQIEDDGVPFIGPQQTIDAQFANPYIWSTLAHYGDQADIAIAAMSDDVGGAANLVVVSVGLEVASGIEWGAYIEQTAQRAGGTYTKHISMPLTGADADPQVVEIQGLIDSAGLNYIALHGSPGAALRLLGSLDKAGVDLPIGGIFAVIAESVYTEGPAGLLDTFWGVQTYTPSTISTPGNDEMNAFVAANPEYAEFSGNVNFVGGWVATKLAVEGITRAAATGVLNRASLNAALGTINALDTGGQSPVLDCTREGRACGAAGRPYDWDGTKLVPRGDYADYNAFLDNEYGIGG
jgi:ABC-type branched-subunit amino acid transport system substrate-binding protein